LDDICVAPDKPSGVPDKSSGIPDKSSGIPEMALKGKKNVLKEIFGIIGTLGGSRGKKNK
jgi:hypothetical protein